MQVVIGAGEVGIAVAEVLRSAYEVHLRDIDDVDGPARADVLHICFPWSRGFVAAVREYEKTYRPELVIIHSSVPIGTSAELDAVHSPVTGKHPNLAKSILTFTKFFGGPRAQQAALLFASCGVGCRTTPLAANTEAGKLWELAQYGLAIVIEKAIHAYCEQQSPPLDFDVVYTAFAENYNAGYGTLGDSQFLRPVLTHVPGPIGGHCVVPGSLLLDHPLASLVAEAY